MTLVPLNIRPTPRMRSQRSRRSQNGNLVEFAPVLFVLFLLVLMPVIDLLGLGTGMATVVLLTHQSATQAANSADYDTALAAMVQETNRDLASGFAKFARITPLKGYQNCGTDLWVKVTNYRNGTTTAVGPNTPVAPPIDLSNNIYAYTARATCDVGPIVNMGFIPLLANVPGLGKPATIIFDATRNVEHPSGLDNGQTQANLNKDTGGSVPKFDRTPKGTPALGLDNSGWNYPGIYDAIKAAGQTVVAENVLVVKGTDDWVNTGLNVNPGQTVWVDSRADGAWSNNPGPKTFDANGEANGMTAWKVYSGAYAGALIGCIGPPPTTTAQTGPINSSQLFSIGKTLTSHPVTGSGQISLMINDNYRPNNQGLQVVRIIITQ
jgi:hypothetical protein